MAGNERSGIRENFSLLIKPAGPDCNARCTYCFYTCAGAHFDGGPHRMPMDVLETMTGKLLALSLPVSQFCWQGGEPTLMGLEWFQEAVNCQMKLGRSGQVVSNAIQTNALAIDDAWAAFFAKYKFLVGVSLDGPEEIHDRYRGQGTHRRVLAAIEALKRHGVEFNILAVVSRANEGRGRETYQWLRDRGFAYLQFIPAVETDEAGEPLPFAPTPEGYGGFLCDVFDAWREEGGPGKVYVRMFEATLCQLAGVPAGSCIMGRRCDHYLVIEHNGDVFPCDFFVRPDLRIGNILEQELAELVASEKARTFAAAKSKWPDECNACEFLRVCYGGCLKDRQRAHGRFERVKTYLCPSYKRFFSHTLEWFNRTAREVTSRPNAQRMVRPEPAPRMSRPGRNAPCPCGSGKKFKQCCGKGL